MGLVLGAADGIYARYHCQHLNRRPGAPNYEPVRKGDYEPDPVGDMLYEVVRVPVCDVPGV